MKRVKLGPGTQVLNQSIEHPMGGEVVPCPYPERYNGELHMRDYVWVQWSDRSIGENGLAHEYVNDLTLTGCLVIDEGNTSTGTYELESRTDGSIQLRLSTPQGLVDLVFSEREQVLRFVAGQHLEVAKQVLVDLK